MQEDLGAYAESQTVVAAGPSQRVGLHGVPDVQQIGRLADHHARCVIGHAQRAHVSLAFQASLDLASEAVPQRDVAHLKKEEEKKRYVYSRFKM